MLVKRMFCFDDKQYSSVQLAVVGVCRLSGQYATGRATRRAGSGHCQGSPAPHWGGWLLTNPREPYGREGTDRELSGADLEVTWSRLK